MLDSYGVLQFRGTAPPKDAESSPGRRRPHAAWGKPEKAKEWRAKLEAQEAAATQAKK